MKKLLAFFGVGTVAGWEASFGQMRVAYRRSPAFEAAPENVTAWIRLGEICAAHIECARFDKTRFREVLDEARTMTARSFPDVHQRLVTHCAEAGVAPRARAGAAQATHMSGLARWLHKDKALIQLSLRYKTADHLWFSFFHEAGHILLHGKKTIFIDENGGDRSELEDETNRFAGDQLIPPAEYRRFVAAGDFGRAAVVAFAKQQGIGAGIVVGRLQHEKLLPYSQLNELKEKLVWAE
ncbi:MAG: ImmA/IrrE family metallo-endopeptidase [Polyangiaceae bacterium]|nr:ImmA/IrrE family metallo-endopeptidase [Polyangiaceae bacterium]